MTLQEKIKFDKLCSIVKSEKEHFLRHQCKSVLESGVYNTLDPKVEKLVKELYELEKKRVHAYPVIYITHTFLYSYLFLWNSNFINIST